MFQERVTKNLPKKMKAEILSGNLSLADILFHLWCTLSYKSYLCRFSPNLKTVFSSGSQVVIGAHKKAPPVKLNNPLIVLAPTPLPNSQALLNQMPILSTEPNSFFN